MMAQYNFTNISPHDFEILTRDLLQARDDLVYESFSSGRDQGIDLRHISPDKSRHIVQCKHWAESGFNALLSNLKNEEKLKVDSLSPERYTLVTSVRLTPKRKDEILKAMRPHIRTPADVLGPEDINNLITQYKDVETSHFKLWLTSTAVLERILHQSNLVFTESAIEDMQRKSSLYVQNVGFDGARKVLKERHSCIIAGAPGIGKTILADMLLLQYMAEGFEPVLISEKISEADALYSKNTKQVFYYDDFLGQTSLSEKLAKNEDARLLKFIQRVEAHDAKRFIMTTREYILRHAQRIYEPLSRADASLPRYVLRLKDYSKHNRAEILYNHVWFSALSQECRLALVNNSNYLKIIDHANYNPRLIEAIIQQASQLRLTSEQFLNFSYATLDNPATIWSHAFENQLDVASKSLLRALLVAGFYGETAEILSEQAIAIAQKEGNTVYVTSCRHGLREMEDTFIRIGGYGDDRPMVNYHNPSIKDFMLGTLEAEPGSMLSVVAAITSIPQVEVVSGYATASDDYDPSAERYKYPRLRAWLQSNIAVLDDIVASCLGAGVDSRRDVPPTVSEAGVRRALGVLWRIDGAFVPEWLAGVMRGFEARWRLTVGNRLEAVKLVEAIDRSGALTVELIEGLDAALRSWEHASYDELESYRCLMEMESARPSSVSESELELAQADAELFVDSQVELMIDEGDVEMASEVYDDLRSIIERFELSDDPIDRLTDALREDGGRDEDYEPDFDRDRVSADPDAEIREMFGSLVDP